MEKDSRLYLHSACCASHWELVYDKNTGKAWLECDRCGKKAESVELVLKDFQFSGCDICEEEI